MFELVFTNTADRILKELEGNPAKKGLVKQVKKALGFLQVNPKHPSLNTHSYDSIQNPLDSSAKVFEAYAQNQTASAYRIFWSYGPEKRQITIIAITPHP